MWDETKSSQKLASDLWMHVLPHTYTHDNCKKKKGEDSLWGGAAVVVEQLVDSNA